MPDEPVSETSAAPDPGAPVPKDAIDPELVSLKTRTQVGLVTAFSVIVLCVYLAVKLWPDFQFAGEDKPREVTVAAIVGDQVAAESDVSVPVTLEEAAAERVRHSRGVPGLRVAPVAGSNDRLLVVLDGDGWSAPRPGAAYTGRLRRLSDLPFASAFRDEWRASVPARHVTADELRRATAAGDHALTAVTGDAFTIADGDAVDIVLPQDPDAATIVASFSARLPDRLAWQLALGNAGLHVDGPIRSNDSTATFELHGAGVLAAATTAIETARLYGARIEPIVRRYRGTWPLHVDATGVTADGTTIPWAAFQVAAVHAARPAPSDPWVVIVGETPDHYWYVRPLYVLFAIFTLLFGWGFVRTARRELLSPKAPTPA